jgi:plastocyanin
MRFSNILRLSTLFATAAVQVTAAQFNVTVGGSGLTYTPEFVTAQPGDVVVFTFQQKNHTVTQSTFASPCQRSAGGFDTGFIPVPADNANGPFPAAQLVVKTTDPLWVYCRQANHCQQGMVFAVNPGDKFAAYKANAMASGSPSGSVPPPPQSTSTPTSAVSPPPTSTPSTGTDHRVIVGGTGNLSFQPSTVVAQPGDTVTFEFHQKNHTATQSTFADPCKPMAAGFNSGFEPVGDTATEFPTYTVSVNDTKPVWVYCAQANHCSSGMVFAVNAATTGNTFEAFRAKAMGASSSSVPPNNANPSSTRTGSPAPTSTDSGAAGRIDVQSITGLSVVLFTSAFFLL